MRINFDFLDLECFLAVKETASFHGASERLNLSQSSITRRIQKLEEALGTPLFDRSTRAVRPTLAAKRLQIRAEAILQEAAETTRALRDETAAFAHQRAQLITLATVPTLIGSFAAPAIRAFRADHPGARIRLLDRSANEVAEAVAQGEADFGLCSIPLLEPSTEFTRLFDDEIVLAHPAAEPRAATPALTWSDLAGDALILPARGTGNRLLMDEALACSATPVHWSYEVTRTSTALDLVAGGLGLAPVPRTALSGREDLGWTRITAPNITRPIGLLARPGHRDSGAQAALKAALVRQSDGWAP